MDDQEWEGEGWAACSESPLKLAMFSPGKSKAGGKNNNNILFKSCGNEGQAADQGRLSEREEEDCSAEDYPPWRTTLRKMGNAG